MNSHNTAHAKSDWHALDEINRLCWEEIEQGMKHIEISKILQVIEDRENEVESTQ